ncbi:unnamed protein product [Heterobilharzia americana]|nr:unnamed protein product [Heterobilharzia americana]
MFSATTFVKEETVRLSGYETEMRCLLDERSIILNMLRNIDRDISTLGTIMRQAWSDRDKNVFCIQKLYGEYNQLLSNINEHRKDLQLLPLQEQYKLPQEVLWSHKLSSGLTETTANGIQESSIDSCESHLGYEQSVPNNERETQPKVKQDEKTNHTKFEMLQKSDIKLSNKGSNEVQASKLHCCSNQESPSFSNEISVTDNFASLTKETKSARTEDKKRDDDSFYNDDKNKCEHGMRSRNPTCFNNEQLQDFCDHTSLSGCSLDHVSSKSASKVLHNQIKPVSLEFSHSLLHSSESS